MQCLYHPCCPPAAQQDAAPPHPGPSCTHVDARMQAKWPIFGCTSSFEIDRQRVGGRRKRFPLSRCNGSESKASLKRVVIECRPRLPLNLSYVFSLCSPLPTRRLCPIHRFSPGKLSKASPIAACYRPIDLYHYFRVTSLQHTPRTATHLDIPRPPRLPLVKWNQIRRLTDLRVFCNRSVFWSSDLFE